MLLWNGGMCVRVCAFAMFLTAFLSAFCVYVCVCLRSRVSSHAWRQSLLILEFLVKMLIWAPLHMCVCVCLSVLSSWVNWLKLPFSLWQFFLVFSLLSGHTLRSHIHSSRLRESRGRERTTAPFFNASCVIKPDAAFRVCLLCHWMCHRCNSAELQPSWCHFSCLISFLIFFFIYMICRCKLPLS